MIDLSLTNQELDLMVELLESESRRVAIEARRTHAHEPHEELRNRERTLDRLLERFRSLRADESER